MSNRLGAVFEETNRSWNAEQKEQDEFLAADGRVMDSMLSEHMCEGWLEGYLLTGRHGFLQAMKRLSVSLTPWRRSMQNG